MKLSFAGESDVGCVRKSNQDSYLIDPEGRFFIVADGMGGHAGGEEASRIATESIGAYLSLEWGKGSSPQQLLQQAVSKANQAIIYDQNTHPVRADSGTTIVVVIFVDGQTWFCHIGDSRLYRLCDEKLEQVSDDHTWIARAIQTGAVGPEEARTHPWRHMLLQCLGREEIREVTIQKVDFQPGDRMLICSDGLTEELTDEQIANQLQENQTCETAAEELVKAAKSHGGRDNVTVVVIANEQ
jgi:PPM family protein phosphatase